MLITKIKNHRRKNQEFSKLPVNRVKKSNIGHTKRNLEKRTEKHFRNLRLNHTDKSVIASHFWNTGIKLTIQLIY